MKQEDAIKKVRYKIFGFSKRPFRKSYRIITFRFIPPYYDYETKITLAIWSTFKCNIHKEWREFRLRLGYFEIHFKQNLSNMSTIRGY